MISNESDNLVVKFADDTTDSGLIPDDDEFNAGIMHGSQGDDDEDSVEDNAPVGGA